MNDYTEIKVGKYFVKKYSDGSEAWYKNVKHHREDGPAIKFANGDEQWIINDRRHRIDGPATKYTSGCLYYINNTLLRYKEFKLISILFRINVHIKK